MTYSSVVKATTPCGAVPTSTWGVGRDVFSFDTGHRNDTIKDFNDNDLIHINGLVSEFSDLTLTEQDGGTLIDLTAHGGGTIFLEGVTPDALGPEHFDFTHFGGEGADMHAATNGNDVAYGGGGADFLVGLGVDETVDGAAGDDHVHGGDGHDMVFGGEGDDTPRGDSDEEHLGVGRDVFSFDAGHGNDTIKDFDSNDVIHINGLVSDFSDLTLTEQDGGTLIDLTAHGGGTIHLEGVTPDELSALDFDFTYFGCESNGRYCGGERNDVAYGGSGVGIMDGAAGGDVLNGGAGDDSDLRR